MEDEEVIGTFSLERTHKSFTNGIGFGSTVRRIQRFDARVLDQTLELAAKLAIIIVYEIFWPFTPGCCFAKLLSRPLVCGIHGHSRMHNLARRMLHYDKGIEGFEKDAMDNCEITSPDFVCMIP